MQAKHLFLYIITFFIVGSLSAQNNQVINYAKISNQSGGLSHTLDQQDLFGIAVDSIGDLNNDGTVDLIVGASLDDDGGTDRGAAYILFLDAQGNIIGEQKVSDTEGNFTGVLDNVDAFGASVSSLGDLNNDGISDVAVGAEYDGDGGYWHGAVWILFLNQNGTVQSHQKISDTQGLFTASIDYEDYFGGSIANIGDLDGDGITDLAVGSYRDDDGNTNAGSVYILFLNINGTVKSHQKISNTEGNLGNILGSDDLFGVSVAAIGDLDWDGVMDIIVGACGDDTQGAGRGAVYILHLNQDGTVKASQKIAQSLIGFNGTLHDDDNFGRGVASIGKIGQFHTLVSGAWFDDDGSTNAGAVWLLQVKGSPQVSISEINNIDAMVYPNPNNGIFNVSNFGEGKLEIFDILGQLILYKELINSTQTINISNEKAGIYYLRFSNGVSASTKKIIIE